MTGRQPLADPEPLGDQSYFDCVVVGSGFGGAVMAARLAPHLPPGGLAVLERGREFMPGDFPDGGRAAIDQVRGPRRPLGLFDMGFAADLDHLVANGLGGGSLIYANVALEPLPEVFERWPASITHAALAPYYERVRQMLAVERYPDEGDRPPLRRVEVLRRLADDLEPGGASFRKVPIAVNLTRYDGKPNAHGVPQARCTLCGDCVTGCNAGAKNDLTTNYLPLARAGGARIFSQVEAVQVTPSRLPGHLYALKAISRERRGGRLIERTAWIHAKLLVVSAGTFGTARLLMTSAREGPLRFSAALGAGFSGNGDAFSIGYDGAERMATRQPGPTIVAMADLRAVRGAGFVVQDGALPAIVTLGLNPVLGARRLERSTVWLVVGHDDSLGELRLDRKGQVRVHWPSAARALPKGAAAVFAHLARLSKARVLDNPRSRAGTPVTVHPLGGCRMADSAVDGVVDDIGRVYRPGGSVHPGLYVADGSICDGSLGANPSLTIAALAERAAERIVAEDLPGLLRGAP